MNKRKLFVSIALLILDQLTKSIVQVNNISEDLIGNFLSFRYTQNYGAAWSMLQGKQIFLIVVSIIMLVLVYNMMFSYKEDRFTDIGFGILFGGILGNLIDRVIFGYVRDFIDIYIFGYDFPIFNIADMGIIIGVTMVIISSLKGRGKSGNNSRRKSSKN